MVAIKSNVVDYRIKLFVGQFVSKIDRITAIAGDVIDLVPKIRAGIPSTEYCHFMTGIERKFNYLFAEKRCPADDENLHAVISWLRLLLRQNEWYEYPPGNFGGD
jgi:hypothetical protein